jgi:hypothetical protein
MIVPALIGATGGSGTRGLRLALIACGAHFGANVNEAGDAADLFPFYDQHINPTLALTRRLDYELAAVPASVREPALAALRRGLVAYRAHIDADSGPWGIKGPRSMYMLPYFAAALDGFAFVHVLRDGRDMALSNNQGQVTRHYLALFGEAPKTADPLAAARLWCKANMEAAAWCERHRPDRYFPLRFEDLCAEPRASLRRLLDFLGWPVDDEALDRAAALIKPPGSIGRWRRLQPNQQVLLTTVAAEGLRRFGYDASTPS